MRRPAGRAGACQARMAAGLVGALLVGALLVRASLVRVSLIRVNNGVGGAAGGYSRGVVDGEFAAALAGFLGEGG